MPKEKWSSVKETAEHLGIKQDTLYKWILRNKESIPAHRIGRLWKFKISEIDKWVKSGTKS